MYTHTHIYIYLYIFHCHEKRYKYSFRILINYNTIIITIHNIIQKFHIHNDLSFIKGEEFIN